MKDDFGGPSVQAGIQDSFADQPKRYAYAGPLTLADLTQFCDDQASMVAGSGGGTCASSRV